MPESAGLLMEQTYRMHPKLCCFTSEVFYGEKLYGVDGLGRQETLCEAQFSGAGLANTESAAQGQHERLARTSRAGGAAGGYVCELLVA
jgi:hypothetical protein